MTAPTLLKREPGDASDIPALLPERIARATVYASLLDYVTASRPRRLWGFGNLASAEGLALERATGEEREGLLIVPRSASTGDVHSLFERAQARPELLLCFLDYVTWLDGAAKNPLMAAINRAVNETSAASLAAFIVDPEGLPRVVVDFSEPAQSMQQPPTTPAAARSPDRTGFPE